MTVPHASAVAEPLCRRAKWPRASWGPSPATDEPGSHRGLDLDAALAGDRRVRVRNHRRFVGLRVWFGEPGVFRGVGFLFGGEAVDRRGEAAVDRRLVNLDVGLL